MEIYDNVEKVTSSQKTLGQFMTPKFVAEFMVSLISKPKTAQILEPGAGKGVFVETLNDNGFDNIEAYEIDETLIKETQFKITRGDFLNIPRKQSFDVVIGNPPYARWKNITKDWQNLFKTDVYWKKIMNGLCDLTYAFIYHSVNLLRDKGELIFICPLFWTETVHGKNLREHLSKNGSLELLINLNESKIFNEVSSTIIIFKYVKRVKLPYTQVIEYRSKIPVSRKVTTKLSWMIKRFTGKQANESFFVESDVYVSYVNRQFFGGQPWHPIPPNEKTVIQIESLKPEEVTQLGKIAHIGNGMVSGLDKAFRLETDIEELNQRERNSIIHIYKARTLQRFYPLSDPLPYIFINHVFEEKVLKRDYPNFYEKLSIYKDRLKKRYNYARQIPWWHWVFLRNKKLFESHRVKIFVPSKERYDTRGYFRFALVCDEKKKTFYPTQDVTAICVKEEFLNDIWYVLGLLNSTPIQRWISIMGFNRGGVYDFSEAPLSKIPILKVALDDSRQLELHELIELNVEEIIVERQLGSPAFAKLDEYIHRFLDLKKKVRTMHLDDI